VSKYLEDRREQGFTLIELLIAIVVVGILAAVAIVGIAGLTNTGSKSACTQSKDAAKAASAAFYANNNNTWPTTLKEMAVDSPAAPVNHPVVWTLPDGLKPTDPGVFTNSDLTLNVGTWTLVMAPDPTNGPTFTCP
jgi:prepilin-type N-terminal cleavage/methylation domain-containing protein